MEGKESRTVGVFFASGSKIEEPGFGSGNYDVDDSLVHPVVGEIIESPDFWTTEDESEPEIERLRRGR